MPAILPFRDFSVTAPLALVLAFGLLVRNTHTVPMVEDVRFQVLILLIVAAVVSDWRRDRSRRTTVGR